MPHIDNVRIDIFKLSFCIFIYPLSLPTWCNNKTYWQHYLRKIEWKPSVLTLYVICHKQVRRKYTCHKCRKRVADKSYDIDFSDIMDYSSYWSPKALRYFLARITDIFPRVLHFERWATKFYWGFTSNVLIVAGIRPMT